MNRHLSDLPGEGEQRDPVADFFARERADIRELPAAPDRWESIVVEARRPVRRSWLPYLAGAAAVAVAAGVVWGNNGGPGTDQAADPASSRPSTSTATPSSTPSASTRVAQSSTAATSSPSTPTPTTFPVPPSFDLVSMTNAGGRHLFALGSATCPKACTAVVGSDDDGATWTTRASFPTLTSPGARTTPAGGHQVVGIRFASPDVGYVYGSTTMRTTDGGSTWRQVDVDGRTVLSLETDGKQVWMVTAARCTHAAKGSTRGCADLQVRTGAVDSSSTTPVPYDLPGAVDNAWISLDGSDAYLNQSGAGTGSAAPAVRLSGKPAALSVPAGCDAGMWVTATANAPGTLLAVCPTAAKPGATYSVGLSIDRGATWSTKEAAALGRPTAAGVWLTATDATHLVAVRQGLPSSAGAAEGPTGVLTSADGGASWRDAKVVDAVGTDWAGAAGGTLVYAVTGGRSYWVSHDSGATFEQVPLRR